MIAAATALAGRIDTGDTAWMLVATALVLMMTPALGLFYAGLVRAKNTLNTFMMSIGALGVVTVAWALIGYSLAFSKGNGERAVLLEPSTAPHPVGQHRVDEHRPQQQKIRKAPKRIRSTPEACRWRWPQADEPGDAAARLPA